MIASNTEQLKSDREIYAAVQKQLDTIKPFLGELKFAIPALQHQKQVMVQQSVELLGEARSFEGYLEVGSGGRYLDYLEEAVAINGDIYTVTDTPPGYSIPDMVDRGQVAKVGQTIDFNHYATDFSTHIPSGSIDLASVYIGFHHCPIALREAFIECAVKLRPSGRRCKAWIAKQS
ncbi:MAG: hypothetical protein P8Y45_10995 [Exilibacterium sp.]